jgi:16S rRNA U516 pseudouridylate synthase RsuA-like enzyme
MVCPVWARGRLNRTSGGRLSLSGDLRGEWRSVREE